MQSKRSIEAGPELRPFPPHEVVCNNIRVDDSQPAFDCQAAAALLRSGMPASFAAHVAGVAAFFHRPESTFGFALIAASLACWTAVIYLAIRVTLDAALFDMLAEDPDRGPGRLDFFLASARLRQEVTDTRPIEDRIQGAVGLWKKLLLATGLQLATLAAAVLLQL